MLKRTDSGIRIGKVLVSSNSQVEVLSHLGKAIDGKKMAMVTTPNPEQVVQANRDDSLCHILNESTWTVPDGIGLLWASAWLKSRGKVNQSLKERITGVDLAETLMKESANQGWKVMLIGGKAGQARKASKRLKSKIRAGKRKLKINGVEGSMNVVNETEEEWLEVKKALLKWQPKVLLVAFGAPKQEKWIWKHRDELEQLEVRVAMVVGGAVDYWAGEVDRAPKLVRSVGGEWLWRLILEPWRWRRQLRLLEFVGLVLKQGR